MERFIETPKVIKQGFLPDGRHWTLTDMGLFKTPQFCAKNQPIKTDFEFDRLDSLMRETPQKRTRKSGYD